MERLGLSIIGTAASQHDGDNKHKGVREGEGKTSRRWAWGQGRGGHRAVYASMVWSPAMECVSVESESYEAWLHGWTNLRWSCGRGSGALPGAV